MVVVNLHGHADGDGPNSNILHLVDSVPCIPDSFHKEVNAKNEDQSTDDHNSYTYINFLIR